MVFFIYRRFLSVSITQLWRLKRWTCVPCSQDASVGKRCTYCLNITSVIKQIPEEKREEQNPCFWRIWGRHLITTAGVTEERKKQYIAGDKWIYRANDKTWGGITDRWNDGGCAANRQNAAVQSRAHLWEQEFVLLHFSRVASLVDLQKKNKSVCACVCWGG